MLIQIVVGAETVERTVEAIKGNRGIVEDAIESAALLPVAVTAVLGARHDTDSIAVEQARILLLRNSL